MELLWQELTFGLPDRRRLAIVLLRVIAATLLGALVGFQRERAGKAAGLRTHMLVSLGTTLLVLACSGIGMGQDGLSRVVQGIVTGIGFVGAGSILKLNEQIRGLTTAAGLWITAAIGVAVGLGSLGLALIGTVLTLIVLGFIGGIESHFEARKRQH
jgi:putative Mg2+ transporter-C (MgtC) family protein